MNVGTWRKREGRDRDRFQRQYGVSEEGRARAGEGKMRLEEKLLAEGEKEERSSRTPSMERETKLKCPCRRGVG